MTIKQLSVFLENKTGRINEVTKILGKHGINMHAFSMAESTDFGILRLIVSEVDKAVEVLRGESFAVISSSKSITKRSRGEVGRNVMRPSLSLCKVKPATANIAMSESLSSSISHSTRRVIKPKRG